MDLIRDVLDNQLIDRNDHNMGRVDGIVVELRDDAPPRLAYIEVGMPTLAGRVRPQVSRWVVSLQSKWGAKSTESFRIPWSKVRDVGINVKVDIDSDDTPALAYEQWLRKHLIGKILGAGQ